ncbi:ABC transporter ATP-binding protein [Mucilaginibacter boryungensis]|uniref:ATP-binding cassette domain-containing protein n=1 Tax=Mucilaginibacter boryungensis TaxID=768480 RepID=A0ABR9XM73_9SPHI|nr:ATP-binding cassette domain-containing protein [Mucilaginibacter boryungensis]MBE9668164.1 ATP-binding cassette domain-containing protein [Mucilaginibacter boryungensis]
MIKVKQLSKHYKGLKAVDDISFEVTQGESMVLLGTSGCGKTTTLKMLNRLIEPTSGEIWIGNKNILQQHPETLRRGIGYVLQNTGLFPHYTIAENIAVVPKLLGWEEAKTNHRINELMEKLHLDANILQSYPGQLSGGQQQRVGLARALVADPPVLLMDEPFGALDNVTRTKIQSEFKQLDELTRKTIIMVTHDVQEAFELGDRICLMDKGTIIQIGTPAELLFNPANDFVKDFLQGQRLQLELKAITLNDIWDNLPDTIAESTELSPVDATVWSAMEQLKVKGSTIHIRRPNDNSIKSINFEQLMAAFNQYQNRKSA